MSGHLGALGVIAKGGVPFQQLAVAHARALLVLSASIPKMFPPGSDFGETDAKAEIWSQPVEFEQAAGLAAKRADALFSAAQNGDQATLSVSVKELGEACKRCHDKFRED
jgi:cytochrome c556